MSAEAITRLVARLRIVAVLATVLQLFFFAGQAQANGFSDWSCKNVPFADKVCAVVQSTNKAIDFMKDPMGYIAQFFNNAVTSLFTEMIKVLLTTTSIDWTNAGFLRTYGMAFGASTVLTVFLWLIAVAKRALQGVPPFQAAGESIGFLLLSVVVTALAPAMVAYVTELFDLAAEAMFAPVASDAGSMAGTITIAMAALASIPGGQIIVIFLALAMLSAVAGVWIELIVRDALILSGLIFGATVFSGLVDRNLWGHCKKYAGVMAGIIASKYITFTTIALATGLLSQSGTGPPSVGQSFATVFTGIGLLWLALYLPFTLAKFLPIVGDELQSMYQARDDFKGRAQNMGSQVGDTFGELKDRFGGKGGEGEEGATEGAEESGSEMETAEMGASATGVGAAAVVAKKGVDTAKDQAKQTVERGVNNATGGEGGGGAESAPDTSSGHGSDGPETPGTPSAGGGGGSGAGLSEPDPVPAPNPVEQPDTSPPEPAGEEPSS